MLLTMAQAPDPSEVLHACLVSSKRDDGRAEQRDEVRVLLLAVLRGSERMEGRLALLLSALGE